MKIAYVIDQLDCGGAEQQLVTLCQGLRRRDHEVQVISIHDRLALRRGLDAVGVPIAVARKFGAYDISVAWRLKRLINAIGPDLVHAYLPSAALMTPMSAWLGVTAPILLSERGVNSWRSGARLWVEGILRTRVAHITCNAEAIKRHLVSVEGVSANKIAVIYNGLRPDRRTRPDDRAIEAAEADIASPAGAIIITCVANFSPVKRHDLLIRAFAEARRRMPQLFLVLVGSGPLESQVRRDIDARQLGAACRVITNSENPRAVLAASHIAVLASESEGCSNAVLEAMAAGLPVVAFEAGGNPELVSHGHGGYLCRPGDVSAFGEALTRLASSAAQAAEMGRFNQRRVTEAFTDDVMVDRNLALYDRLLSELHTRRSQRGV